MHPELMNTQTTAGLRVSVVASAARKLALADHNDCFPARRENGFCEIEARAQLQKILESADFVASQRLRRFLTYVVEQAFSDEAAKLTGPNIAVAVFGRDRDFDANDPVVRIEAGRLRRAMERYYLLEGKLDPVLIDIPKGGYVPRFSNLAKSDTPAEPALEPKPTPSFPLRRMTVAWAFAAAMVLLLAAVSLSVFDTLATRTAERPPQSPVAVSLAVRPFMANSPSAESFVPGLAEELLDQMSQFKGLTVSARSDLPPAVAGERRLAMEGSVSVLGERLTIRWRLMDAQSAAIIRAASQSMVAPESRSIEAQVYLARQIAVDLTRSLLPLLHQGSYPWEVL